MRTLLMYIILFVSVNAYTQVASNNRELLNEARKEIVNLKDQLYTLAVGKTEVENELRKAKDNLAALNKKYAADLEVTENTIAGKYVEITRLKSDKTSLESGSAASEITIDSLEGRVELLRKELKRVNGKRERAIKDFTKLKEKTRHIDDLEEKAKRLDAAEAEKNRLNQTLTAEENKNAELEKQNSSLQSQLTTAQGRAATLEGELGALKANYEKLKKDSKAYAAAIRKRLVALQQQAQGVMQKNDWTLDKADRKAMLEETTDLKNQVADGDKKTLASLSVQVAKINALGEVIDRAEKVLAANYNKADVANARANLQRADVRGFSTGIVQKKSRLLALLGDYCKQYARVQDIFRQFNSVNKPQTTLNLLPRLMTEKGAVDTGLTFIRKQLDRRKANPAATDQPFTEPTDCK